MGGTVSIPANTAEALLSLYKSVTAADAIYKNCQDKAFRQFIKGCYKAKNVESAYSELEKRIREEAASNEG